jgi:hypothetical protein
MSTRYIICRWQRRRNTTDHWWIEETGFRRRLTTSRLQLVFSSQSPWKIAHNSLPHYYYSTLGNVIGWRRHRTTCNRVVLWTLTQWWRVSKTMHSSAIRWFLDDIDRANYNSSNVLTYSPVRVNVQSQIVQRKINSNNTDRQNRWMDRLIL